MPDKHLEIRQEAFIASLAELRDNSGASYRMIESLSPRLAEFYGQRYKDLPSLAHSAVQAICTGQRAQFPGWESVATIVLCCQRIAFQKTRADKDPGPATLSQWRARWEEAVQAIPAPAGGGEPDGTTSREPVAAPAESRLASPDLSGYYGELLGPHAVPLADAAQVRDPEAAYRLGILLAARGHVHEALGWLERAARTGHPGAAELVTERADAYLAGAYALQVAEQLDRVGDFATAIPYYECAADRHMVRAAVNLGNGYKARGDTPHMARWYAVAAYMGDTLAQYQLEQLHRDAALAEQLPRSGRAADDVGHVAP